MATIHPTGLSSGSGLHLKLPRISGFTILEHLHEGSHSSIYRASQDRLGRMVALKLLPEWPPPADVALERFNRSAYASAQVPHPNLLTLYDFGTRDGYYFASLEHAAGQSLQRWLAQTPKCDERFAIGVGLQAARALTALNARGICHRNVKPKNIFVENNGRVRLIGLGLASCKGAFYSPHLDANPIGTPHFMAPEMIRGVCADPRSDLYSLGVTLFLMTAGRTPFNAGVPTVVLNRHLTEAPLQLAQVRPDLSSGFIRAVQTLIARDPEKRFQTAAEAADVFEAMAKPAGYPQARRSFFWSAVSSARASGRTARALARPALRGLITAAAALVLLWGAVCAVAAVQGRCDPLGFWPFGPAFAHEQSADKKAQSEAADFNRLLRLDDVHAATPELGAEAWTEFLGRHPRAQPARLEFARMKLERCLRAVNETLRHGRPLEAPAPSMPQPPADSGALDF